MHSIDITAKTNRFCSDTMVPVAFQFCFAAAILCPCVRFDVLTALIMKSITTCCLVQVSDVSEQLTASVSRLNSIPNPNKTNKQRFAGDGSH